MKQLGRAEPATSFWSAPIHGGRFAKVCAVGEGLKMRRLDMFAAEHRAMCLGLDADCIAIEAVLDTGAHVLADGMFSGCGARGLLVRYIGESELWRRTPRSVMRFRRELIPKQGKVLWGSSWRPH